MKILSKPTAIELFSGAGGLSIGLEIAGFNVVLANEIEKNFAETFKLNHPNTKMICDDICNIDFAQEMQILDFSEIDLISGGPPCQGFSTVGSKNAKDPRNNLFYEYLRAVNEIRPKYIIFENVSGFKSMYNGNAFKTLVTEFDLLGYFTRSSILEASNFGLPQLRKRTIIVGWKKELPKAELPDYQWDNFFKLSLIDAISDLPELKANDKKCEYKCEPQNEYQKKLRNGQEELTEHNSSDYGEKMLEILSLIPTGGTINDLPERLRPKKYFANTYARLFPDKPAPTITRNFGTPSSSRCVHPFQNRALSTREGARLQGFPDSYKFFGSKTSKNLQIGNAVPPIFGEVIAKEIIKSINQIETFKKTLHADMFIEEHEVFN
ncbi:DNA-cytosine methyltransferase [uncultured Candidatus Thioglobus sp.]|nr:DNA-cytosine methyltransferase [uncultured Candidatus Thioglobus sp.]